jgi:uncharacterized protein (DUF305 family)
MRYLRSTPVATATLALTAALGLTGCGNDSAPGSAPGVNGAPAPSSTTAAASQFNEADVAFAGHMILHHQQAVQMADIAGWQAKSPTVKKLATAVRAAQAREMTQLSGWLTSWGKPVPKPSHGDHEMSDAMPGTITEDEMSDLGAASGTKFDRKWLQLMIEHHRGAITMARTQQTSGENAPAIALAKKIQADQNREIATMQRLLGQLPTR